MEPSEEIRRIVDRWTKSIAEGDAESVLARLSEHAGTLIIGTDPAEWWHGSGCARDAEVLSVRPGIV